METVKTVPVDINYLLSNEEYYLGRFESEELAEQAYNQVATHLYGQTARLNPVPQPMHSVINMDKVNKKNRIIER